MNDLELALAAAARGADIVRSSFGSDWVTEQKSPINPVTEVDRKSEEAIVSLISEHRPDDGFLAEEGTGRPSSGRRWVIDPLDGTVNFVHNIPLVAVSVALYDGDDPLVGVVVDPVTGEVFAAEAGAGATRNGESIHVTPVTELQQALIATGFPYDRDQHGREYCNVVGVVLEQVHGIRRGGSAALDLCWVACGRFAGYWEFNLGPWDAAAGALIAAEAGATISDGHGRPWKLESPHCLAVAPGVHRELLDIITPLIPAHVEKGERS